MNDGTDVLMHHGIKGQKWGVRRFQNPDGTYTPEGKVRRNESLGTTVKNKWNGLSDKQKTAIKVGAAAVTAALVTYGAYKVYKNGGISPKFYGAKMYPRSDALSKTLNDYSDNSVVLKSGTVLQRVSREAFEDLASKGQTYVSYAFRDNMGYKYGLPRELIWGQKDAFVHKMTSNKEIKAPSSRELASIYLEMFPNSSDQSFRTTIQNGFIDRDYSDDPVMNAISKNANQLKNELIKRGYNAIIDMEDASKKGSIAPLILFNPGDIISSDSSHKLGSVETMVAKILR